MSDHYETLGVAHDATHEELKRAYRKLAREHHPDANPGDLESEARFKKVSAAYEVLSDPERRSTYDRFGTDDPKRIRSSDPFSGGLGSLFEAFFGQDSPFGTATGSSWGGKSGPPRGEDVEAHIDLDLRDVVFGAQSEVQVRTAVRCKSCDGSGAEKGTTAIRCDACAGSGQVRQVRQSMFGQMVTASPCDRCHGLGERIDNPCSECQGHGRIVKRRTYKVEVPVGVEDGTILRLTGRGAAGPRGGPNGDLYVHTRIHPHPYLRRDGHDLIHEMHIPVTQAALGAKLNYETLDGSEKIVIASGTETGTELSLSGKGVPHIRGTGRGNLLIRFVVDVPDDLTLEQADLLRKLAELRGEQVTPPREGLFDKIRSALR